ncbi:MAG TPA: hypothetical protein PL033_07330 [Candidatus Brocadiia bacterium]|nr:hypothetical protein [Candidatus Brocadiia bacterium]
MSVEFMQQASGEARAILDAAPVSRHNGITLRSVLIGLLCVAVVAGFTPYNDWYRDNTFFVGNNFSIGVLFMIAFLVLACNTVCKRFFEGAHLSFSELAVILTMAWAACVVPTSGLTRYWIPTIIVPARLELSHSTFKYVLPHIPDKLMVCMDPDDPVMTDFFFGNKDGKVPWDAWIGPLLRWSAIIIPFMGMLVALSILIRQQWMRHEQLTFPLSQVMVSIIEEPARGRLLNSFFHNPLAWIGLGAVAFLHLLNGLHVYYPQVPSFPLYCNLYPLFWNWPWWHMTWGLKGGPILVGVVCMTVLVPKDVAFSIWFFMLASGLFRIGYIYLGIPVIEDHGVQQFGGYLVLGAAMTYVARSYLWKSFRNIRRLPIRNSLNPEDRQASWGMFFCLLCSLVCMAWLWYWGPRTAMSLFWFAMLILLMICAHIVLTRMVCEAGVIFVMTIWWPGTIFLKFLHVSDLGPITVAVCILATMVLTCDMRETLLPYACNSQYATSYSKYLKPASVALLMMLAVIVALAISPAVSVKLHYKYSLAAMDGYSPDWCQRMFWGSFWEDSLHPRPHTREWVNFGCGAGLTALLTAMHLRFVWWPFHPIGYVAANTWACHMMVFSTFLGWCIKWLVMRYGGSSFYLKVRPLFIGGAIGEALISGFWMMWAVYLFLAGVVPKSFVVMPQ